MAASMKNPKLEKVEEDQCDTLHAYRTACICRPVATAAIGSSSLSRYQRPPKSSSLLLRLANQVVTSTRFTTTHNATKSTH